METHCAQSIQVVKSHAQYSDIFDAKKHECDTLPTSSSITIGEDEQPRRAARVALRDLRASAPLGKRNWRIPIIFMTA
jgi:hypothetical protein